MAGAEKTGLSLSTQGPVSLGEEFAFFLIEELIPEILVSQASLKPSLSILVELILQPDPL